MTRASASFRVAILLVALLTLAGMSARHGTVPPALSASTTSTAAWHSGSQPTLAPALGALLERPPLAANGLLVRDENAREGSAAWRIRNYAAAGEIQAYAGRTSVNPGEGIDFYVSTRMAGTRYRAEIYRMGWYGGLGARLMASTAPLVGLAQGYYTSTGGLAGCRRCRQDLMTGLLEAHWLPAYHLDIPASWLSGIYLALFTDEAGKQTYSPFVVRQDSRTSALLVQASFNTYEAYNAWGGKSLYDYNSSGPSTVGGGPGAVKVSFDRPFESDFGSGQFLRYEYNLVRWLERMGYDVSYTTNDAVASHPDDLLHHRGFISSGHDEYWTLSERQAVETALTAGLNLAFLGGDDVYWQARFEPDAAAVDNRTLVVYRGHADPLLRSDPSRATLRWVDPPVSKPQSRLTGTIYAGQIVPFVQDWVVAETTCWLLRSTGLHPGQHVPGLVGKEVDRAGTGAGAPPGLTVLSRSEVTLIQSYAGRAADKVEANSTIYTADSGANVFSAGTITWSWGLDAANYPIGALHSTPVSLAIQRLTANLLDIFAYGPPDPP